MQIKSVITAAVAATCLFSMSTAIAAYSEQAVFQETIYETDNTKSTGEPKTWLEALTIERKAHMTFTAHNRVGYSRGNHRDARVCLDEASNPAIIRCAEKYRYR